ncbi:hypothetical protein [Amycolatopsis sp. H20-H5]|uniref:hypothetical protein n=1 Tax=Amycolatopsis sp. H20-H5 TaxID=3046309 RepID=UPI002DB8A583|nr:hypothetical protein [Amycolatopsis sp. H20-H5]MEC3979614.1 hypothetical protein [Amycolatopsis sp. H20-H5]
MSTEIHFIDALIEFRRLCTGEQRREIGDELKKLGGELIPLASSRPQRRLEAGLLLAAGAAVDWVHSERNTAEPSRAG